MTLLGIESAKLSTARQSLTSTMERIWSRSNREARRVRTFSPAHWTRYLLALMRAEHGVRCLMASEARSRCLIPLARCKHSTLMSLLSRHQLVEAQTVIHHSTPGEKMMA